MKPYELFPYFNRLALTDMNPDDDWEDHYKIKDGYSLFIDEDQYTHYAERDGIVMFYGFEFNYSFKLNEEMSANVQVIEV